MKLTLRRTTRALAALFVAAFLSGCYAAAISPQTSGSGAASHGYASYETSTGGFGAAVFTSAPRPPGHDDTIWYYGNHPHPANHALGSLCSRQGSHRHDYVPYQSHRYAFHDGHYFWVGDAKPYAQRDQGHAYQGHHPHPHYFGGTCRIQGVHQHAYAPASADYYRLKNGAYFYTGTYESNYYAERDRYDVRGWKLDHRDRGYHAHKRARQETRTAERLEPHQVTLQELQDRMRARAEDASESAPANAAAD
jgi:hypothetical protein